MKDFNALSVSVEEEIREIIHKLCDIAGYGIHSGINVGKKGNEAASYILNKLHATGLQNAISEPIKVNSPFPEEYEVVVEAEGKETALSGSCFPLQWTSGTPSEGIAGELVYVGYGLESDFKSVDVEGKIVLIDEKFMRGYISTAKDATVTAIEKGAAAVFRANATIDSPQQQKGEGTPSKLLPVPVFCFGKQSGNYLRQIVTSGIPHTVRIRLIVHHKVCDANNIVFELPGNGSTDEVILVGTHYDTGHFTGAVDNNGSVALMIKWAEYFANRPKGSRNRDMIFAWCFGHDFDLNSGHYQFASAHEKQLKKAVVWDVDHAVGGIKYRYDETLGKIVPVKDETCEFYIISNNYTFSRLAGFVMGKHGFLCTHNHFREEGSGPQWGIAPTASPWVNVASIPLYYHSIFDTPDKITSDQIERAYAAHIEILENIDRLPDGFLFYDNISKIHTDNPPRVSIAILSETVYAGDVVKVWNDETRFYADKMCYHHTALAEWGGTTWDWGDGTPAASGGPVSTHIYNNPGSYSIIMNFTDTNGATAQAARKVTVLPLPKPTAGTEALAGAR